MEPELLFLALWVVVVDSLQLSGEQHHTDTRAVCWPVWGGGVFSSIGILVARGWEGMEPIKVGVPGQVTGQNRAFNTFSSSSKEHHSSVPHVSS